MRVCDGVHPDTGAEVEQPRAQGSNVMQDAGLAPHDAVDDELAHPASSCDSTLAPPDRLGGL